MRELCNVLRYVMRYGIAWRAMPNDFPPWAAVYQQMQRWMAAQFLEALAQDLRAVLRLAVGRKEELTAAIIDSRTRRPVTGHLCVGRRRKAFDAAWLVACTYDKPRLGIVGRTSPEVTRWEANRASVVATEVCSRGERQGGVDAFP